MPRVQQARHHACHRCGTLSAVQVVRTPYERFAGLPSFPYAPRHATLPDGLRMHYIDEGPGDGEAVLLLHGQPTWSYLYRTVVARLAEHGLRAVAPDLIGFGRSDKPLDRTAHTVQAHVDWLAQFAAAAGLTDVTLVVQDWGGPIGLGLLRAAPGLVRRVVAANTVLHTADPALAGRLEWACHAGPDGTVVVEQMLLDYQRLTQELTPFRPSLFVQGATESDVPDAVLAAYDAPFPDETFCAGPRQLPLLMGLTPGSACARLNHGTMGALAAFDGPFLTAFSDRDPATRGWAEVLQGHVPGAAGRAHVTIEHAGHFLQEDSGPRLADVVAHFVQGTPPG
jgi:haloalkane dehalogenase